MAKKRSNYTAEEKVAILRRHLLEKVAVSELCDEYQLDPSVFYHWQEQSFQNGTAAFHQERRGPSRDARKIAVSEEGLANKNKVIAEADEGAVLTESPENPDPTTLGTESLNTTHGARGSAGPPKIDAAGTRKVIRKESMTSSAAVAPGVLPMTLALGVASVAKAMIDKRGTTQRGEEATGAKPDDKASAGEAAWGQAVEGVQVRLRAKQSKWNESTVARLWADVRNQGKRNLFVRTQTNRCELEVDGRWYRRPDRGGTSGNSTTDAQVNATDLLIARNNTTHLLNALRLITVPGAKVANVDPVEAEYEPAHDAVLGRAVQRQTSHAKFDWLHQFEEEATRDRPSEKHNPSKKPLEALLASL